MKKLSLILSIAILPVTSVAHAQSITGNGGTVTTTASSTNGISATANASYPDVKVQTGDSASTSGFHVFSSSSELLRVQSNGYVAIGSNTPRARLDTYMPAPPSATITKIGDFNGNVSRLSVAGATSTDKTGFWGDFYTPDGIAAGMTIGRYGSYWGTYIGFHTHPDNTSAADDEPEVLRIDGSGNVGIGTTTPKARLDVDPTSLPTTAISTLAGWGGKGILLQGPGDSTDGSQIGIMTSFGAASAGLGAGVVFARHAGDWGTRIQFHTHPNDTTTLDNEPEVMRLDGRGYLGIGLGGADPAAKLQVAGDVRIGSNGTYTDLRIFTDSAQTLNSTSYDQVNTITPVSIPSSGTKHTALYLKSASASGATNQIDLVVDGNIAAKYQDVAEWVPATGELAAGTLVTIDPNQINHVLPTAAAYDTAIAGVISPKPGITLGEAGASKALVATTGRVRVRATASHGAIHAGDLLVASDEPGVAMLSTPIEINGTKIHRPGTVLGKALEPLASGEGEILVLLSLQ